MKNGKLVWLYIGESMIPTDSYDNLGEGGCDDTYWIPADQTMEGL